MKQYMIFLLLVLIISCAPTVEVDRAKPVEDVQEPEEIVEEPEIPPEEGGGKRRRQMGTNFLGRSLRYYR